MDLKQAELRPEEQVTLKLRGLYERYGYKKYKMSKFEEYSLYSENKDFLEGNKIITFTDLDGRLMALKPDVTLSIIKNSNISEDTAEKAYYLENVYRESKDSRNFKEINQMGLELIGALDDYGITEVLSLAADTLAAVSPDYILEFSHMDYVVALLGNLDISEQIKFKFLRLIRTRNVDGIRKTAEAENLTAEQQEALCAVPSLYGDVRQTVEKARKYAVNETMNAALDQMLVIYDGLREAGAAEKIQADLSIVNDIDYYNGIIFNGYVKELAGRVLAGGQYDRALKHMGKKGKAIGFALYLNDINSLAKKASQYDVDAVVLYDEGTPIPEVTGAVKRLQENGMSVFAAKKEPEDLRCRNVYQLINGKLSEKEVR
ncbi:MAG: ATP phosphoribosyltransferase regulatory subunit [Firmicutes bacterium]|nr:ATP phosphoribosyltransferase regulatory subunit [Bacillota bacterium]MBR2511619.1 ATP phosphoribosyltransferase regulatory subunit [Bacillota bacterium]